MPAAMAPGRANRLYVVVVGDGVRELVRVPFLLGGGNPAVHPLLKFLVNYVKSGIRQKSM